MRERVSERDKDHREREEEKQAKRKGDKRIERET